jgi:hypothetical protein
MTLESSGAAYHRVVARAANARRLEARLDALPARRTGALEEVLAVERELARVREAVERHEARRRRYLGTRAATGTLVVTVRARGPLRAAPAAEGPLGDAARAAGRNVVALLAGVVATSGVWAPLGVSACGAPRRRGPP